MRDFVIAATLAALVSACSLAGVKIDAQQIADATVCAASLDEFGQSGLQVKSACKPVFVLLRDRKPVPPELAEQCSAGYGAMLMQASNALPVCDKFLRSIGKSRGSSTVAVSP